MLVAGGNHGVKIGRFGYTQELTPVYKERHIGNYENERNAQEEVKGQS